MKAFTLIKMAGGHPDLSDESGDQLPYHGHVLCSRVANWGAYLISGSGAQLQAIQNLGLSRVIPIVAVSQGEVIWPELDGVVPAAARTRINNWVEANHPSWPRVQSHHTFRQVVDFLFKKFHANFDLRQFWVRGPED